MNEKNLHVLTNIIGAVESGGQVYGKRRYDAYDPPYKNSPKEHTITIGWAQCYGPEARQLIQAIYDEDKTTFWRCDDCGIAEMLKKDWVAARWNPTAKQKKAIVALIDSKTGHEVQDRIFRDKMQRLVADCVKDYPGAGIPAQMMYCEIRHLGGRGPCDRIFKRCGGDYSLDRILAALVQDQRDASSDNQVGDTRYWSRHVKCRQFIEQYAVNEDGEKGEEMAKITEKDITLCGHGGNHPRLIRMDSYLQSRYSQTASARVNGRTHTWHRGVVAVVRPKNLTPARVEKYVKDYLSIIGRNFYSQTLRGYCYKKYKDGRYYSDCSSSQCLTLARAGLPIPELNTVGMYRSSLFERVPVKIEAGHILNPEILKVGDQLLFAGSDYYRELHIGHVEGVIKIAGGSEPTPTPTPTEDTKGVKGLQAWLNTYYPQLCVQAAGDRLTVDGQYGPKTRAAAVTVFKHMANKYYGAALTIGNLNFFESCRAVAKKMTLPEIRKHGTLAVLLQGLLSAGGYYLGDIDGSIDVQTETAIQAYRKKNGLSDKLSVDADMWYKLFN